ncbi:MAG: hypothetical protein ACWGHO_00125 [Candidatus Moraniibacteriota bacterium]
MGKIRQKYNKIREKMTNLSIEGVNISKETLVNLFDIDRNWIKNSLLLVMVAFLSVFTYISVDSLNNVKVAVVEPIQNLPKRNIELENRIKKEIAGFPIESMTRYIAKEDERTAAFIIAIAKKESNWGKRTPKMAGQECYNFWGFREKRERMGSGGHTCFDNPEDAVKSVAKRINDLIEKDYNTPEKMVVWKCGYNCDAHNPESVTKWIDDVRFYYNKF